MQLFTSLSNDIVFNFISSTSFLLLTYLICSESQNTFKFIQNIFFHLLSPYSYFFLVKTISFQDTPMLKNRQCYVFFEDHEGEKKSMTWRFLLLFVHTCIKISLSIFITLSFLGVVMKNTFFSIIHLINLSFFFYLFIFSAYYSRRN